MSHSIASHFPTCPFASVDFLMTVCHFPSFPLHSPFISPAFLTPHLLELASINLWEIWLEIGGGGIWTEVGVDFWEICGDIWGELGGKLGASRMEIGRKLGEIKGTCREIVGNLWGEIGGNWVGNLGMGGGGGIWIGWKFEGIDGTLGGSWGPATGPG